MRKGLTVLQNIFLSFASVILILPKNVYFTFLINVTEYFLLWNFVGHFVENNNFLPIFAIIK